MRRLINVLLPLTFILVTACLAAGCGSAAQNAVAGLASSRSIGVAASRSSGAAASASPSSAPSPNSSASPSRTASASPSPTASASPSRTASASPSPTVTPSHSPLASRSATPSPTAHPTSSSKPSGGSSTSLIWLWILLGAAVLVSIVTWITLSARRRSAATAAAAAAGWRSSVIDAYAKGSALYDAMSVAEAPAGLAAADAASRWSDIQRRADDLGQTLYALRETAVDEEGRAKAAEALASLQAVRSAMDAERAPGGAGEQYSEVVRSRLSFFEAALRALRSSDQPRPGQAP
jgi:hypothetical protein